MSKHTHNNKQRGGKKSGRLTLSGPGRLALGKFLQAQMPDETCIKLVYSDFRSMTAGTSQAEYVYRGNSLFDCDFTGVGGQPDGFDQWKTLYGVYRVVAVDVEVSAVGGNGFGLIVVVPTTSSSAFSSAEEAEGFRKAKAQVFTTQQRACLKGSWHTGEILGKEDVAILSDPNDSSAVTTNPAEQTFIHVCAETTGASDIVYFWIKLTYYVRLEAPISTLDSVSKHRRWQQMVESGVVPPLVNRAAANQSQPPQATQRPLERLTSCCLPQQLTVSRAAAPPGQLAVQGELDFVSSSGTPCGKCAGCAIRDTNSTRQ